MLPYNDLVAVEKALKQNHKNIAAIIVEPVAGNMGVILPRKEFLPGLRKLCDRYGVLLVFEPFFLRLLVFQDMLTPLLLAVSLYQGLLA